MPLPRQKFGNYVQGGVAALLLKFLLPVSSRARTPVAEADWHHFDLPPLYIVEGEFKYRSFFDTVLPLLLKTTYPNRAQTITTLPLKLIKLLLRQSPRACVLGLLKNPERDRDMLFSLPFLTQLTGVFKDGRLTLGVVSGPSYGATLDEMLAPQPERQKRVLQLPHPALQKPDADGTGQARRLVSRVFV